MSASAEWHRAGCVPEPPRPVPFAKRQRTAGNGWRKQGVRLLARKAQKAGKRALPPRPEQTRGRRETRVLKLDATPEQVARAIFNAAKPPRPSKQHDQDGSK